MRIGRRMLILLLCLTMVLGVLTAPGRSAQADVIRTGKVTARSGLKLRSTPKQAAGNEMLLLPYGAEVKILSETEDADGNLWYQVTYLTDQGYVSAAYVEIVEQKTDKYGKVTCDVLNMRSGPGSSYSVVQKLYRGDVVAILDMDPTAADGQSWYNVSRGGQIGYVSGTYLEFTDTPEDPADPTDPGNIDPTDDNPEYWENLQEFPADYQKLLKKLHAEYPGWVFIADYVDHDWDYVVEQQYAYKKGYLLPSDWGGTQAVSLVDKNSIASWKSTEKYAYDMSTGTWITNWDGSNWAIASREYVSACLDPRNWLNDIYIFQFLDLRYDPSQTAEAVRQAAVSMRNTWLDETHTHQNGDTIDYPAVIAQAGAQENMNPLAMVALITQEIGTSASEKQVIRGTMSGYENLYNYFNIGAYTDGTFSTAWSRGLWIASLDGSWYRPWNTREKAIRGGANYYVSKFVQSKTCQNTFYYVRFDVNSSDARRSQFSTDVQEPQHFARLLSGGYSEDLRQNTKLVFHIPVYENMPSSVCAVPTGNAKPIPLVITEEMEAFVTRLYRVIFDREPDEAGLEAWCNQLASGDMTAAQVAYGFIFSQEYKDQKRSMGDYLDDLYAAFFDRAADEDGKNAWIEFLQRGQTREFVFSGFVNSSEFGALCKKYGLNQGSYQSTELRDRNPEVTAFAARMYTCCLNRAYEDEGLQAWVELLLNQGYSGGQLAYGFFMSPEMENRNLKNGAYLDTLYRTMFDREPDQAGKDLWLELMEDGMSREAVLYGFTDSQEFMDLCERFGINR